MRRPLKFIDPKEARKHLDYDPETGWFRRKIATKRCPVGHIHASRHHDQYTKLEINRVLYAAHRVAWVYMTGEQPDDIDHINGLRHDNRFINLRNVSRRENILNGRRHRKLEGREYVEHYYP